MHRAASVSNNFILGNISAAIDQIYKDILYDKEEIMQGMKIVASPWKNNFHSAFVNGKLLFKCRYFKFDNFSNRRRCGGDLPVADRRDEEEWKLSEYQRVDHLLLELWKASFRGFNLPRANNLPTELWRLRAIFCAFRFGSNKKRA